MRLVNVQPTAQDAHVLVCDTHAGDGDTPSAHHDHRPTQQPEPPARRKFTFSAPRLHKRFEFLTSGLGCAVQITLDDSASTGGRSASATSAQAKDVLDARLAKLQTLLQQQDSLKDRRSSLSVLVCRLLTWTFQPKPRSGMEKGGARVLQATGEGDVVKPPAVDTLAKTGRMTGSGRGTRMEARLTGSAMVTTGSLGGLAAPTCVPTDLDTLQHHFLGKHSTTSRGRGALEHAT